MKIIFLIPPSEGKNSESKFVGEKLNFVFKKPSENAINSTEKDLKCRGKRFDEAIELNKKTCSFGEYFEATNYAISRYSGVMFSAINYENMNNFGKKYFEENFLILSGMYGIVKPLDKIQNYKLPIEAKGLFDFWGKKIIDEINELNPDFIINLLPISYTKMIIGRNKKIEKIFSERRKFNILNINFINLEGKKISHGVKKIKGEWIKNICENNKNFFEKKLENYIFDENNILDLNIEV